MRQFESKIDTPKALANVSPGFELARTLGRKGKKNHETLKALGMRGTNPYRV
jgi:hypothetical protein